MISSQKPEVITSVSKLWKRKVNIRKAMKLLQTHIINKGSNWNSATFYNFKSNAVSDMPLSSGIANVGFTKKEKTWFLFLRKISTRWFLFLEMPLSSTFHQIFLLRNCKCTFSKYWFAQPMLKWWKQKGTMECYQQPRWQRQGQKCSSDSRNWKTLSLTSISS